MDRIIKLKIDLKKVDKSKLFKSEATGSIYLDATLLLKEEKDQYDNNGMIVQQISKEDRAAGKKGAILGNAQIVEQKSAAIADSELPM